MRVLYNRIVPILITHYPIRLSFLTAINEESKIRDESSQDDLRNALSCYIKGIDINCKDDGLNVNLNSQRADLHTFLGEFTGLHVSSLVKFTNS